MTLPVVVLDTDTLSAVLRDKNAVVTTHAQAYTAAHPQFTFSIITRYEVLRGLKVRNARRQLTAFERFCTRSLILPLTEDVLIRATDIYADLHRRGALIQDGDIFIAATALVHGLIVVTNNEKHFRRIPGLTVDNWFR